jgi:hypothetical protein
MNNTFCQTKLSATSGIKANRKLTELECSMFEDCLSVSEFRRTGNKSSATLLFVSMPKALLLWLQRSAGCTSHKFNFGRMANHTFEKHQKKAKVLWPVLRSGSAQYAKYFSVAVRSASWRILATRAYFATALADLVTAGSAPL